MQLHRGFVCFRLPRLADLDILQVSLALYSLLREVIMMMQFWVKGKLGPGRFFVANWAGVVRKIPKEQAPTLLLQINKYFKDHLILSFCH